MDFSLQFLATAPAIIQISFWLMIAVSSVLAAAASLKSVIIGVVLGLCQTFFWLAFFNHLAAA